MIAVVEVPVRVVRRRSVVFCVLGRVAVVVDGRERVLGSTREAALLADLLVHANQVVSAERLIDDVWRGAPPPGAAATLQTYVKNLRRLFASDHGHDPVPCPLETQRPGYRLVVGPDDFDAWRSEKLINAGRQALVDGDAAGATTLLREALALWMGRAFGDLAGESFAQAEAVRLEELRLAAVEDRVQAELTLGHHAELCGELEALVTEHPYRERLWEQWMVALYRAGRQAEALRAYQRVRHLLADELGIEPGEALRHLEESILLHDPQLDRPTADDTSRSRAPATVKGNLAGRPPELLGRAHELEHIEERLRTKRLVSLVGVGGVGKTSLALAVSHAVRDRYPDGVWFVELAPVLEAQSVAPVVAGVFGHHAQAGMTLIDSLCALLARKEALLVLDNCEHLLGEVAAVVEPLLSSSRALDILVTSREALALREEHVVTVAPLPAEDPASAAVQLFLVRAEQTLDSFALDDTNRDDIAAICRDLDGLPLAIELAATRVRSLSPREIRDRLADRLQLLHGGRGHVERHQTLRQTMEWSCQLLTPAERALLGRVSLFVGGFTLGAAEVVVGGPPVERSDVLDALDSLVAKSLVVAETHREPTRYRLLETIRQFAFDELRATGALAAWQRRYATYFHDALFEQIVALGESEHPTGLIWIHEEFDNLRAAFEWLLVCDVDAAMRLSIPMGGFGWRLLHYEAGEWPAKVIATRSDPPDEVPADLLGAAVHAPVNRGDIDAAQSLADRALAAARRRPPSGEVIEPWGAAIVLALYQGDGATMLALVDETRRQPRRAAILDDTLWHYTAWANLLLGDMEASRAAAEEADRRLRGKAYAFFADWSMARVLPDPTLALARYERAYERVERLGFRFVSFAIRREIGRLHCFNGQPREALRVLRPVVEQFFSAGDVSNWTGALTLVAMALASLGEQETAVLVLGAGADRRSFAYTLSVLTTGQLDHLAQSCREGVGAEVYEQLYERGRHATDEEIMDAVRSAIERLA